MRDDGLPSALVYGTQGFHYIYFVEDVGSGGHHFKYIKILCNIELAFVGYIMATGCDPYFYYYCDDYMYYSH